jgi:hypothetical protein
MVVIEGRVRQMSDVQGSDTTPTLAVSVLRDGVVVKRELVESDAQANAVVEAWADVEGVEVRVEDLTRSSPSTVLDPRPWEVDADDAVYAGDAFDEDEER